MSVRDSDPMTPVGSRSAQPVGTPASQPSRMVRRNSGEMPLSPGAGILMAISFGICAGFLDLFLILCKKFYLADEWIVRSGRDFPWTLPVSHAVWLLIPGAMIAAMSRLRPGLFSYRSGSWLLSTLALWAALLRLPLYGACSLILAAGLGRPIGDEVARRFRRPRTLGYSLAGLIGVVVLVAMLSSGRQAFQERRAVAALPRAPSGGRNVLLIVWDTVRAYNLSAYGYPRNTTPHLSRWAREGIRYNLALAPAPWTYPSHSCFFTGHWPFQLNSQWKFELDTPEPTLAEYLAARGYQTAGFSANTSCCNYETGLARGFSHFEDFPLTPRALLGRTVPGNWILLNILYRGHYHAMKWIRLQSRGAFATNEAFLGWLRKRRPDRPFFAFLNYFDAHAPYVPPPGFEGRFGIRPRPPRDYHFLLGNMATDNSRPEERDIQLARDCYDDCIAFLDEQLGRLLDTLRGQGILDNTLVIITSDHGEAFGDHGYFGHSTSLYLDVTGVPLVILAPGAPAGRVVNTPVSLRDVPTTVVDQLGLTAGSPFPGRSLAAYWPSRPGPESDVMSTPALSEQADAIAFQAESPGARGQKGFQMSVVSTGHHYLRNGMGAEILFDLRNDPTERINLIGTPYGDQTVGGLRRTLLDVITESRGSKQVEQAYLATFRQGLDALIHKDSPPRNTEAERRSAHTAARP
jgi:arylsulfatase A-like enzyme